MGSRGKSVCVCVWLVLVGGRGRGGEGCLIPAMVLTT